MATTNIPAQYPDMKLKSESDAARIRTRSRKIRDFLQSLFSHTLINFVGLFFLVPFLWMLITAFKSNTDIFHTPPRWLPYDNVYVKINSDQYPLYTVQTLDGVKQLAALKIVEGVGTFVDPNDPAHPVKYEIQQGNTVIAQPILHVSFRWQNFSDAMNRASRPSIDASFWVYFKNSLVIAFFTIIGTLLSNAPVAYAFARLKFPGRDLLFVIVLATMMLPYQVTMIPLYLLFNNFLHWGDTFLPLIVPAFLQMHTMSFCCDSFSAPFLKRCATRRVWMVPPNGRSSHNWFCLSPCRCWRR